MFKNTETNFTKINKYFEGKKYVESDETKGLVNLSYDINILTTLSQLNYNFLWRRGWV